MTPMRNAMLAASALLLLTAQCGIGADLELLRDVACRYETRGEPNPDAARGAAGERGQCQPMYTSALAFGGLPAWVPPAALHHPALNRAVALRILRFCAERSGANATAYALAYCYNRGPYEPVGTSRAGHLYARAVAHDYGAAFLAQQARLLAATRNAVVMR